MSKSVLKDGLSQSDREGHGFWTKSIWAIAENHGGQAIFTYMENEMLFNLKIMIPLREKEEKEDSSARGARSE